MKPGAAPQWNRLLLVGHATAALLLVTPPLAAQSLPGAPATQPLTAQSLPSEAAALVATRPGVGLVVGRLDGDQVAIDGFGQLRRDAESKPDGATLFEIGSITKVFTGIALASLVAEGKVRFDEPIGDLLPKGSVVPAQGERQITLLDLATHSSALPRLPPNFAPKSPRDPYADYDEKRMLLALAELDLKRPIGSRYEYSNFGVGLLGQALARRAGVDFERLVVQKICEPLQLADTRITLSDAQRQRLAAGHDAGGRPTPNWTFGALAGAGALRSTANDLLRFARAQWSADGELGEALRAAQQQRWERDKTKLGLGWHLIASGKTQLLVHDGGTGGYRSFLAVDVAGRRAVVVLCNWGHADVNGLGMRLLR